MAYQRIRIKNSNTAGKIPTAGQLDTAELCINLKDKKLFSKDADGNVFEFESDGSSVGTGPIPPGSGNETGDLWWDGDFLLVWNGTDWEKVAPVTSVNGEKGDVVLSLGDINDVTLTDLKNSDIISWNGSAWINKAAPPTDISGNSLNDLSDVNTGTPAEGDMLIWVDGADEWQTVNISSFPSKTSDLINDGEGTDPFITDAGVTKIVAGTNVTIDPVEGTGEVTINAADAPEAPVTSVNGEVGDVVLGLDDLNDVTLTALQPAEIIAWDGSAWTNRAAPPTDISGNSIGDLNDVDINGVADGDILVWDNDAGEWKPEAPSTPDGQFVKLNDEGTEQSIIGGGGLDVVGGITSEFGTDAAQLGNVAPLNDWSCYPARPTTFAAPAPQPEAPVNPIAPTPTPTPAPTEEVDPGFGVEGGFTSSNIVGGFTRLKHRVAGG